MNGFVVHYLIAWLVPVVVLGVYFLARGFYRGSDEKFAKFRKLFGYIAGGLFGAILFAACFIQPGAMEPNSLSGEWGKYGFAEGVGCVELVGVPYGENKAANFFALFQIYLFFPFAFMVFLNAFYHFKSGRLLSKWVLAPMSVLHGIFLFNLINGLCGSNDVSLGSIFYAASVGFMIGLSILFFLENRKERFEGKNSVFHFTSFLSLPLLCCIPIYACAVLFSSKMQLFGMSITAPSYEVHGMTELHRIYIYLALLSPLAIYFLFRHEEEDAKTAIVLLISFSALFQFMGDFGLDGIFPVGSDGIRHISVGSLPIHLCHTALYVVPLCVAFKWKRLFYFTYFINVFGAIMAMINPNVGEDLIILAPSVFLFWDNHITAYMMPLLCVALKLFDRPKFKQMVYSLLFFGLYFVLILIANAWFSNYVSGYDPNVLGSGTDYLFINGTYILDLLSDSAYHLMDFRWEIPIGNVLLVFYPIYQVIFFFGYAGIAFVMWFIYSLFFRIADLHQDVHIKAKIAKLEHLETLRYRKEHGYMDENLAPVLEFRQFAKRYGNSDVFAVDHIDLKVTGGQIFGFLGPNGAGKSTCIKTAIGIQPLTEGHILVCGYDVKTESTKTKRLIGYVPDHYALYEKLTGREYINYIADLYGVSIKDRDERIAKYVDIFELQQAFDNRMATYSHGMKQKMTIIAALVHDPKVWILDEPLTGLDPQSIYQVKQAMIAHAKAGNIVFFSSHIIDVVEKLCTDIAIIKQGHIIYQGKMEQTLKDHPEGLENFYMKEINEVIEEE